LLFSILFFFMGFFIKLIDWTVKWLNFKLFKIKYPFIHIIIKYLLFIILLFDFFFIVILVQKIWILLKGYIFNKLKDWKFNINYKLKKGNKSPKTPVDYFFFLKKKKEEKKEASVLKEKILKVQENNKININTKKFSLSEKRNFKSTIEIPKASEFNLEKQIKNIDSEYKLYDDQEKKFKKIVIDITNNKEKFYPNNSKSLFENYVDVVKILKKDLEETRRELKRKKKS
jgi:hypothetical protein